MALKYGNPSGKGGRRPGSGRPKDEFIRWCQKVVNDPSVRKFVFDLASGNPVEERIVDAPGKEPVKMLVAAPAAARMKAIDFISAYAYGKPAQTITADDGVTFPFVVVRPQEQDKELKVV